MHSLAGKRLGQIRPALPGLQRGAGKFSFARNARRLFTRTVVSLGFKTLAGKCCSPEPAISLGPSLRWEKPDARRPIFSSAMLSARPLSNSPLRSFHDFDFVGGEGVKLIH